MIVSPRKGSTVNEKEPKVRQFILDADVLDGDGEDIADDQFGSGGARRADGTLINQYKNPRPYEADTADEGLEFDTWLDRESKARTQRDEAESQAAYDRRVQQAADGILWVLREEVAPIAQAYGMRAARRTSSASAGGWPAGFDEVHARRPPSRARARKLPSRLAPPMRPQQPSTRLSVSSILTTIAAAALLRRTTRPTVRTPRPHRRCVARIALACSPRLVRTFPLVGPARVSGHFATRCRFLPRAPWTSLSVSYSTSRDLPAVRELTSVR